MTTVTYEVVEHDGGWAYKVGDVFSETFPTHDDALDAARNCRGPICLVLGDLVAHPLQRARLVLTFDRHAPTVRQLG